MKKVLRATDVEALIRELQRYLAYVDAFRAISDRRGRQAPVEKRSGSPSFMADERDDVEHREAAEDVIPPTSSEELP